MVSEGTIGYKRTFQVQYIIEGAKKIKDFQNAKFHDFTIEDEFEIPINAYNQRANITIGRCLFKNYCTLSQKNSAN